MDNKKIITATIIVVVLTIIIIIINHSLRNKSNQEFSSDKAYREQLNKSASLLGLSTSNHEAIRKYFSDDKDFSKEKIKQHFTDAIVNEDTLNFFWYMDDLFKDSKDLNDNLNRARQYLYSVFPPEQAQMMLDLYNKHLTLQIDYYNKKKDTEITRTPEEAIANLYKLQESRRAIFGRENADIIFGNSVRAEEYTIRRNAIITDRNMAGLEKERKLSILNESIWDTDSAPFEVNTTPYEQYQEKLQLYSKDLSELRTEEEKEALRQQLQRQTLSAEDIQRLTDVDRELAEEKKTKEQYYALEKEILDDPSISQETKDMKIRELQDATFGEEAEAFRRRQAIQKETERLTKSSPNH
jgi:Proteobacterial lipase chaperone protein.